MTGFSPKRALVRQTERVWGDLTGAIYRDFKLGDPLIILAGPLDRRSDALPIVEVKVKRRRFKGCVVTGECEFGQFGCDLLPIDKAFLGSRTLVGELKINGVRVGIATIGPTDDMATLGSVRSHTFTWEVSVRRKNEERSEGDVVFQNSEGTEIAQIVRRDVSWTEQLKSGFGFRRSKRGLFMPNAHQTLRSAVQKMAFLFLLACYFRLLELHFNTDITSS